MPAYATSEKEDTMTEHTNFLEVLEHLEKHGAAKAGLLTRDLMLAMNKQQPMEFASASFGLFCFLNLHDWREMNGYCRDCGQRDHFQFEDQPDE